MITAIINLNARPQPNDVACNLAVLRARTGRKVCLLDLAPRQLTKGWSIARGAAGIRPWVGGRSISCHGLEHDLHALSQRFNDLLVDIGSNDTAASRQALAAAKHALVLVLPEMLDLATQYALIQRLNAARSANPGLRVTLVPLVRDIVPGEEAFAVLRAFAHRVSAEALAQTEIHLPSAYDYGPGRCVCDAATCDPELAEQLSALYREIFALQTVAPVTRATSTSIASETH